MQCRGAWAAELDDGICRHVHSVAMECRSHPLVEIMAADDPASHHQRDHHVVNAKYHQFLQVSLHFRSLLDWAFQSSQV